MEKVTYESVKEFFAPIYIQYYRDNYSDKTWYKELTENDVDFSGYLSNSCHKDLDDALKAEGLELIEQDGGGEGGTEDCFTIIKFKGEFYKLRYWYRSHHGYEGFGDSDFVKVIPKKIEVTVYE